MTRRPTGGRDRREPVFDAAEAGVVGVRLSRDERLGGRMGSPKKGGGGRSDRPRRRSLVLRLVSWSLTLGIWAAIAVAAVVGYHATQLPPIDQLAVPKRPPNVAILAADGSLLANRGETGGRSITLKEVPPYLPRAFVAIEDRRFFSHFGVDPLGVARAAVRNVTARGVSQGGSTLTQQLAKNLFLTQERTASRKIQEAILALWLEHRYGKDQILELYLNRVYFGAGAYGVEAAAQRYYGKGARDVTVAEAATLAGLVQAPSRLAPNRNPEAARARAELVLAAMADEGFITAEQRKTALARPAQPVRQGGAGSANYAADLVMDVLDDFVGTVDSDITVRTTIDPALQAAAERALVDELAEKGGKFGVGQGAVVAMRPDGALRALVGGRNYAESQFNRATTAKRQPGSAFKPFVYLAALESGLTPDTVREDGPIAVRGWQPENYTRDYRGPVTLRDALAMSLNTVAVRVGMEVGPRKVVDAARRLGIASPLGANASIALGTSEVSPLELVGAYAPFANGGFGIVPFLIAEVKGPTGKTLYRRAEGGLGRVIDAGTVGMMNGMMRETLLTGTARRAEIPGWEAAGKTGTTQEFRDAWFVGFTGSLVAGVWLGNDDGSPTRKVSGSNLPVDVWAKFMRTALARTEPVPLPGSSGWRPAIASGGKPGRVRQAEAPRPPASDPLTDFFGRIFGQ